jgi:hypothetical protein
MQSRDNSDFETSPISYCPTVPRSLLLSLPNRPKTLNLKKKLPHPTLPLCALSHSRMAVMAQHKEQSLFPARIYMGHDDDC